MDVVAWTDEGRAELAREHSWGPQSLRDADDAALRERIRATVSRYAPCWQRGLERADDAGGRAAELACAFDGTQSLSISDAAGVLSLLGSRGDGDVTATIELLVRAHGFTHVFRVLAAMWGLATNYKDPDWPKSEDRLVIWCREMSAEDTSAGDASVSYAKGDAAKYLGARMRSATPAERADVGRALAEVWAETPLHARGAIAVAADDTPRAEEILRDLLAKKTPSYPHWALGALPLLIRDLDLLRQLSDAPLSMRFIEAIGADVLPFYEAALAKRIGPPQRERMLVQLQNVRGPATARLLAGFAEKKPYAKLVRAYFTRYPELAIASAASPTPSAAKLKSPAKTKPKAKTKERG